MTDKEFVNLVKIVEMLAKEYNRVNEAVEILGCGSINNINLEVIDYITQYLTLEMNDKFDVIHSWIFEHDFGKKEFIVVYDSGEKKQLKYANDLYNFLKG